MSSTNAVADLPLTVEKIMKRQVVSVKLDSTVLHAQGMFNVHHFHHLLVVDGDKLVGILSDRDLLKNVSPFVGHALAERPQDLALLKHHVHMIMTRKPITVKPSTTIEQAVRCMIEHDISCLPVVDDHCRPIGIVSWKDLIRGLCNCIWPESGALEWARPIEFNADE